MECFIYAKQNLLENMLHNFHFYLDLSKYEKYSHSLQSLPTKLLLLYRSLHTTGEVHGVPEDSDMEGQCLSLLDRPWQGSLCQRKHQGGWTDMIIWGGYQALGTTGSKLYWKQQHWLFPRWLMHFLTTWIDWKVKLQGRNSRKCIHFIEKAATLLISSTVRHFFFIYVYIVYRCAVHWLCIRLCPA